jgi:hypothetical protein
MKRLVPLIVGALVLIAFALAQRAIGFASTGSPVGESPVAQTATTIPIPGAPIMTPIPTLTPLPVGTPLPVATAVPSVAP